MFNIKLVKPFYTEIINTFTPRSKLTSNTKTQGSAMSKLQTSTPKRINQNSKKNNKERPNRTLNSVNVDIVRPAILSSASIMSARWDEIDKLTFPTLHVKDGGESEPYLLDDVSEREYLLALDAVQEA